MNKELPRFRITIDDEYSDGEKSLGIEMIAFVKNPAVKVKGMAFNAQEPVNLFFADEKKYRIVAPAMIPMEIYRNDESEYYVQFTAEEIEKIHSKFMATLSQNDVFNLEHNSDSKVPAYVLETWFVEDPETDKAKTVYGIDVPKGTLMMTSQITDKDYYTQLVENGQTGYSIEGFLGLALSLSEDNKNNNINKNEEMTQKFEKMPAGEYTVGDKIYVIDENGEVIEVKDVVKEELEAAPVGDEEIKEEEKVELAEEVKEEEKVEEEVKMQEEIPADSTPEETQEADEKIETYSKAEIDAKFDELYQMIADLATSEVKDEVKEMEYSKVEIPFEQKFTNVMKFLSQDK